MKLKIIETIGLLLVTMMVSEALAFKALDDDQLNQVTAGNAILDYDSSDALTRIPLLYSSKKVDVDGEVIVLPMQTHHNTASLQLMDNAQSNLRSLININAVDSPIQVLLNLNINVQSTIDRVIQLNNLSRD